MFELDELLMSLRNTFTRCEFGIKYIALEKKGKTTLEFESNIAVFLKKSLGITLISIM